jgi:hypothetical protein
MNLLALSFTKLVPRRVLTRTAVCALVVCAALCLTLTMLARQSSPKAIVRHGLTLNGRIEGSVQQLVGEATTINGGGALTGDLFAPGTPTVKQNGHPTFGGTVQGSGSTQPSNYQITLNGNAQLGRVVTRTDPVAMPPVAAPPASTGTRDVTLNNSGQSAGNFATVRDLTLNGNVGTVAVPPGTYRNFTVNGGGAIALGVAGASQPAVYNLNALTLNGNSRLDVVGPIVLTMASAVTLNASMGSSAHPLWLNLKVASGGVTLNGGGALYGSVTAPSGTVTINGNASLIGGLACDRLTVNGNGLLQLLQADTTQPTVVITQPAAGATVNTTNVTVTGTFSDESPTTIIVNGAPATIQENSFTADVPLNEGGNTLLVVATDSAGNRTELTRTVTRDTIAPTLSVASPQDFTYTNAGQVLISGSFDGASSITVNGAAPAINGNGFSATVPLTAEGVNTITVHAVDAAGNQSDLFHTVYRDTNAPTISLVSPSEGEAAKLLLVAGNVADASPVTLTVDGVALPLEDGSFERRSEVAEGARQVRVAATDAAGNHSEVVRSVLIDTTAPLFSDVSPSEGATANSPATVSGRVTDAAAVTVKVNDTAASVGADGTFTAGNISLVEGENQLLLTAVDAAGNQNDLTLTLIGSDRTAPGAPALFPVTSPTRLTTSTVEGRAEPGSEVLISGGKEPVTTSAAFGTGLFTANIDLNVGANSLSIVAKDAAGNASPAAQVSINSNPDLDLPPAGEASQINISTGNAQKGLVSTPLPRPLIALVTDRAGNPVANVSVRFTAQVGGGQFVGGNNESLDVNTDAQGYARATYVSGSTVGLQQIRADFSGNTLSPAVFLAEALESSSAETTVSGVVLDQNLRGLPHVLVRIGGQQTRTGADGRFKAASVAAGPHQLLELIGRDQITLPGRWPNITYDLDVLPGVENELGRPLFLPKVNAGIDLPLDDNSVVTQDTTYELPAVGGMPPVRVTAKAGTRVVFPPDVTDKRLSVTRIAANRIPMSLDDGRATNLYISVQPSGTVFETPLEISFPNLDALPANSEVLLMSFDHDAGRYVKVGTGHVTEDGREVRSDAGSGIHIGAWHALPPPKPKPEVTVLGHIQIAGNPAFEGKTITKLEAWVDGEPATVTPNPTRGPIDDVSFVTVKVTLVTSEDAPHSSLINSTVVAEKKLKIKFDSADSRFAPSVEKFNFKYTVTSPDPANPATYAKFEVFKASDLNNPIYLDEGLTPTATKLDYSQGGAPGWDGKMNQGSDAGKYIEPKDGPFTIRLSAAVKPDKSDLVKSEDKTLKVEIDSMEMTPDGDYKSIKPSQNATEKDTEVQLTVKLKNKSGSGVVTALPLKIKWIFEDPDDTAGNAIIDPNGGAGNDNIEIRFGGKAADTGGGAPAAAKVMWKAVTNFTDVIAHDGQTADSELTTTQGADQGTVKITFSTSTIGGDNYYLYAKYLKDDGTTVVKDKKSGKWSVWKKLEFTNAYRMNGGVDISSVASRGNINPAFNGDGYTDYTLAHVNNIASGAMSPEFVSPTILPPNAAETPVAADTPAQITAKAQAWFARNRHNIDVEFLAYVATLNAPVHSLIGGRYYHPKYDSRPGTGQTNYWPAGIQINTSDPGTAPLMRDPDDDWSFGVPGTTISERAFIFLNAQSYDQFIVIGRHEIGHASDHVLFNLPTPGTGDHATSGLMHPNADPSAAHPFGDPEFSPDSIRKLRGIRP